MRTMLTRIFGEPQIIGGGQAETYLTRWFVVRRANAKHWPRFNIYLHNFNRSDDDRALHCHPWWSISILLKGNYLEHAADGAVKLRRPFRPTCRSATTAHRVELIDGKPVWTLFITGPKVRDWGFHCPKGWLYWREFEHRNGCGED
jgi:hypothetical protein